MQKIPIVGILDLDGIRLGRHFNVRELAFASISGDIRVNQKFHLDPTAWANVSMKDRKTAYFVSKYITCLPVRAQKSEFALPQSELKKYLTDMYNGLPEQGTIGYKGGQIEVELLSELGIPSVNLENYGCPKFERLNEEQKNLECFACLHHIDPSSVRLLHCSSMEVEAFRIWWNYDCKY